MAGEILTIDAAGFVKYAALSAGQLPASGVTAGTYGDATHGVAGAGSATFFGAPADPGLPIYLRITGA